MVITPEIASMLQERIQQAGMTGSQSDLSQFMDQIQVGAPLMPLLTQLGFTDDSEFGRQIASQAGISPEAYQSEIERANQVGIASRNGGGPIGSAVRGVTDAIQWGEGDGIKGWANSAARLAGLTMGAAAAGGAISGGGAAAGSGGATTYAVPSTQAGGAFTPLTAGGATAAGGAAVAGGGAVSAGSTAAGTAAGAGAGAAGAAAASSMPGWVTPAIQGGLSVFGGLMANRAASDAVDAQLAATREGYDFLRESRDMALEREEPFYQAGIEALAGLESMSGLSDEPYDITQDPSYQFRLGEGIEAYENSAFATGGITGGMTEGLLRYAQDYASTEYDASYRRLLTLAGYGQQSSGSGIIQNFGESAANLALNAGEARGTGYIARSNAWQNSIDQLSQIDWSSLRR
jgi:hypothetical protein